MKRLFVFITVLSLIFCSGFAVYAENAYYNAAEVEETDAGDFKVDAVSAVLMEANTGKILYSSNENESRSPASVTKIMTLLLVMEAIEEGRIGENDSVTISAHAASMGGSQVFLEEGESMTVSELLKCTVIASANDAAVALAEYSYGSEDAFVSAMNKRAEELGMSGTNFENVTGLDDTTKNHVTSANDIAIMSRELIKYDKITEHSSKWQDTIRNGEFTLTNTNRLVRFYDGCNGLKTGSTDKAGYCISVTAKRGEMQLIAVIMGATTRDIRNAEAKKLLDFGFANYGVYTSEERALENVPVNFGTKEYTTVYSSKFTAVIAKSDIRKVEIIYEIPECLNAPIKENDAVGKITYRLNGETLGTSDITVKEEIGKVSFLHIFKRIILDIFAG